MFADDGLGPFLRSVNVEKGSDDHCGFHLTRSKWDPYPWVSSVDPESFAEKSGLKIGDCLLEVNGEDVLGRKISDIAGLVKSNSTVALFLWNSGIDENCSPETICCGPMPRNFQKLTTCTSSILSFLECPICLDTIGPPCYQCDNGHLICVRCRAKSERCPICRSRFNRGRSLLADQIYNAITEIFELKEAAEDVRNAKIQQIFKLRHKNKNVPDIKITHAHTNKFLAKLTGKSSSVGNLASGKTDSNLSLGEINFKAKSLSSTELFDSSPLISRSNSMRKLCISGRTSASCRNSYESLTSNDAEEESPISCPFESNCLKPIISSDKIILEHFQTCHTGPLIQYFKPTFKIHLRNISDKNNTYIISFDEETFFVKIIKAANRNGGRLTEDLQLWTWHSGKNEYDNFYMTCEILNENITSTINISVPIYSLNKLNWKDVTQSRKGIVINGSILESEDVSLKITIKKNEQ